MRKVNIPTRGACYWLGRVFLPDILRVALMTYELVQALTSSPLPRVAIVPIADSTMPS